MKQTSLRKAFEVVCLCAATLAAVPYRSNAQTGTTARVTGTVTDQSGAVLEETWVSLFSGPV
jgi:hypothetical protein